MTVHLYEGCWPDFHQQITIVILFLGTLGVLIFRASTQTLANHLLSCLINVGNLFQRYPIKSKDGIRSLPTCPFEWPNGHGDVAKFLMGIENSTIWEKEHGSIYRIWSGMNSEVVLTNPEHIQKVFHDSDKHFKAINNDAGWLMGEILGRCVGLISQEEWKRVRAVTMPHFLRGRTGSYIPAIERRIDAHFRGLHKHSQLNQGLINPVNDLKMLPFGIVADILYGPLSEEMECTLYELIPLRESLFKRIMSGGITRFRWSRYLPTAWNRDLKQFKSKWSAFNDAAYEQASTSSYEASIIQLYNAVWLKKVSKEEIHHTLDEMLFANLDVTIGSISWNVLFLAADRSTQETLRHEISDQRAQRKGNVLQWKQYLQSPSTLLASCTYESSRLKPLAAFSVPQAAPTERVLGGYVVPAGTNYIVDSYALNVRNSYWGEDSQLYRPTRWLGKKATEVRYYYWRFGFGPRTCLGKNLADLMLRTILAHLVENYVLELSDPDNNWERNRGAWITQPTATILCRTIRSDLSEFF